ncbi:valine--tRNA ligase [Polymorphobacter sp. PAMC 29334]|uniref:valine--tRNA ligase n=1 Tax=Polymorphobacter sp. PAMC 29334 TaxID=2862331 RepID=UPI001C760B11|nr:valine--tRNA ligase [Polymorphobacter sp. PAMC 29334]QYE35807.1 valine--tRNA ligase [Polymorphobacter sp. PAMC 29334]
MTTETNPDIIDKTFDPAEIEARLYAHWESTGAFRPARPDAKPFTIVIPPPNVTGSLHIGHALDNTLQDVLIRYHRLKGRDALWVVGTDHAGIATQMVVERTIASQGLKRADMSREAFLSHVWEWKAQSGDTITRQLRRLGASCDWAHERFTMDPGFSAAVTKVFVDLYNQVDPTTGKRLLYRDKRLVNWDPKLQTAISDLEVEPREVQGSFTHIRYPLADGVTLANGADHIIVATTRPETMLGDTAVAVNPGDERYQSVIGAHIVLPLTGRRIPIVADEHADPELGSGAVKITPAHDFNDWLVFERHREIGWLNILDAEANIVAADGIPAKYVGMTRENARKAVVADLEALDLIELIEAKTIQMPYGDRSGVVIEPWLTDQWYVDAATLAKPAIEAVRSGATKFVPTNWDKTYFNWMENIQPWCVSRQITWGHQIPAWYSPDGKCFVAKDEPDAADKALSYYSGRGEPFTRVQFYNEGAAPFIRGDIGEVLLLRRDSDVLDTWFSSALWPFGTLGWPEQTPELARYYPGDVLVTGFDIIFFWVARMMMQGIHFMGEVPFATVYCHGLVRDAKGAKMSKSKGNTVDPLALIDRYGADALRFTLTAMESQGRDIKLDEKRVEGYRNFATKLWNAARFCQSNGIAASSSVTPPAATAPVNRWIIGEVVATARALDGAIAAFRFDGYAETAYQFVWSRFCDWYLELTKPLLAEGADAAIAAETRAVTGWALDQILVMLHPVMPFLTEELWHKLGRRDHDLILAAWPVTDEGAIDTEAAADIDWLIALVTEVRSARNELNIPPGAKLGFQLQNADAATEARHSRNAAAIERLARIVRADGAVAEMARMQVVDGAATISIPLGGVIDISVEKARLEKNAAAAEKERDALTGRLASPGFVDKAKPEAVDKARADLAARGAEAERLRAALARLG